MLNATGALAFDRIAILLDVDGTILDLAPTPRSVFVPPPLRRSLDLLFKRTGGALALVSGRPLDELDQLFLPLRLPAIGGHGAEFRPIPNERARTQALPLLDVDVRSRAAALGDAFPSVLVEDKGYSLALHYRLAPERADIVRKTAEAIRDASPIQLELLPGKSMIEIKQAGFNKGSAVRELMTYPPFHGRRPIFIGDDVTDRDVFDIMSEFNGIAMSVSERHPGADHCFGQPSDVRLWLDNVSRREAFVLP